jgi:hypothetical protein
MTTRPARPARARNIQWPARVLVLAAVALVAAAAPARAEEFTRTLQVARGVRLDVRLFGGGIVVRAWDREQVRVHATHFRTDRIEVRAAGQAVTVRARSEQGAPHAIDLDIDVPAWMAVGVSGTYVDVSVSGTKADVRAETVRGDIHVRGGAGAITLKTIEGEAVLEGAEGTATLHAVNDGVRVTGFRGTLFVETVNGGVKLEGTRSLSIVVGTVGGDVSWDGPIADGGQYQFATHYGDIDVHASPRENATVSVRAFDGQFRSTLPAAAGAATGRQKRFSFVLGTGAARLELETFRGVISVRPPDGR